LAKEILSGSPKGKEMISKIVDDIKKQLKDEDYQDATGEVPTTSDIPGFEGTMDALDGITIRPTQELDMDTILDKINKMGMESLTKDEKDFLYNL